MAVAEGPPSRNFITVYQWDKWCNLKAIQGAGSNTSSFARVWGIKVIYKTHPLNTSIVNQFPDLSVWTYHTVNSGVDFHTRAVWRWAAPLAIQLAHSCSVADDATSAYAAVPDDWAYCSTVAWDLSIGRHAGAVTQHHCPMGTKTWKEETNLQVEEPSGRT